MSWVRCEATITSRFSGRDVCLGSDCEATITSRYSGRDVRLGSNCEATIVVVVVDVVTFW